jgi:DNA-binding MarR family transcriptional regulator
VGPAAADRAGAWVNLAQVHRVIQASVEERLEAETGLSWSELEALMRLASAPGRRLKMVEIADQLLVSKSGITRLVDRLEANRLIAREVPPDNRRVIYGRITEAGLDALEKGRANFMAGLQDSFSRHLSDAEVLQLRCILRKLLEGNGAWEDHRCLPAFGERPEAAPAEGGAAPDR